MTRQKQLTIGISALVGAVIIALLAFLYVTVWAEPTKKDFTAAKAVGEKIAAQSGTALFQEFALAVSAAAKEGKSYDQIIVASRDEKATLISALNVRTENAVTLAKSPALRDEEVKKAHATYAAEEKKYDSFFRSYVEAYPGYISSFTTCDKVYRVAQQARDAKTLARLHTEASTDCLKDLRTFSQGSLKPLADFATGYIRIIEARQKVFDDFAAGTVTSPEASARLEKLGAESAKLDPNDELLKLQKDSLFNGELTALINLLGKKAEQAK